MKILRLAIISPLLFILSIKNALAHRPLCTAGAAIAAGGALWLGISKSVVSLFLGAFAVSMGWWISRLIKKKYIPLQRPILILLSFLLTIIPLLPIFTQVYPVYISWIGEYGSLLNRTYILNPPLYTSILGGIIVSITPLISKKISSLRKGKMVPFQGIFLTFGLLILLGVIIQIAM